MLTNNEYTEVRGGLCPFCESDDIGETGIVREFMCNACKQIWMETYILSGYEPADGTPVPNNNTTEVALPSGMGQGHDWTVDLEVLPSGNLEIFVWNEGVDEDSVAGLKLLEMLVGDATLSIEITTPAIEKQQLLSVKVVAMAICNNMHELDENVAGTYFVSFLEPVTTARAADAALDIFHSAVPVAYPECFEFSVFDDAGNELKIDEEFEAYSLSDLGTVEKLS